MNEAILYRAWLAGTFGSPDSAAAKQHGPELTGLSFHGTTDCAEARPGAHWILALQSPVGSEVRMLVLSDLSQSRLAVFIVGHATGLPLRRVPVYAEAVLNDAGDSGRSPFERFFPPEVVGRSPELFDAILRELESRVDRGWVDDDPERAGYLIDTILGRLGQWIAVEPLPEEAAEDIHEAVKVQANEFEAPWPEDSGPPERQVIPMGLLATDHAGFASWDLERLHLEALVPRSQADATSVDFWLYPNLLEANRVAASDMPRVAYDAVVVRIEVRDA
ncbi:hypothetical protein ACQE98_15930 [Ornithinimicrobium sp. W1679]|uniref:hypothetical protein n=1 Tax=Ornithinimicrobium sp. W1679 TaxID=3418770 RepID=UPI003CF9AF3F